MRRSKTSTAERAARGNFTPPRRTAGPPADASGKPPVPGSTSRLAPRNWRVPTRLNAILLIPVLVGLVMGGFQVKASVDTWQEAQDAERTALVVRAASEYGQALLNERDLTAQPLLTNQRDAKAVVDARAATDAAKAGFDRAVRSMPDTAGLERRLRLFRGEEPKLEAIRQTAYTAGVETPDKSGRSGGPVATEEGYVLVQHSLMEFSNELGLGTGNITSYGRTVYAIQLSKAAASLQRSIGLHLLVRPSEKPAVRAGQSIAFSSYAYLEDIALAEYVSGGTDADTAKLRKVMTAQAVEGAKRLATARQQAAAAGEKFVAPPAVDGSVVDGMVAAIATGDSPALLEERGVTPGAWMAATTAEFDGYTIIEKDLVDNAVGDAAQIADGARNDAVLNGAIVVIALLAAFVLAGMMARQMSRSMRQLRTAAFGIAEQRLPMLVDQLSRTEPGRVDTRVQPIPIDSRDEIGEVARAFDQVHREAVRLAAEQAMLRGNVNAIFTNLSRRNQSLIEGQLTLITELENNEAEPEQLENLFKLDHLATRMRRNGENLLVLAGEEPGRRWNQPVPLVDVLRAASSEVESYERIELSGVPETEIHGQAVTDLVHLLAELLENATTFSSPQTKVRVTATRLPDGRVMIEIHDKGIGLTADDFADINHKLANPPTVDAAVSQRMGLFVVGRLADRHGVRVQLRPSGEQAGTTSLVMLPDAITHGGGGEQLPPDDFTVSQIIPEQRGAAFEPESGAFSTPMLTAAELGFDDSRYDDGSGTPGADPRSLDPVNRSLMRDERRAALGGGTAPGLPGSGQPLYGDQVDGQYREGADGQFAPQEAPYEQNGYAADRNGAEAGQGYQGAGYDAYGTGGGYPAGGEGYGTPDGYPEQQDPLGGPYPEAGQDAARSNGAGSGDLFAPQANQGGWSDPSGYQGGYESAGQPDAESPNGAAPDSGDRVEFERPGPSPSTSHTLTGAGLPRRGGPAKSPKPGPGSWETTGGGDGQQNGHDNGGVDLFGRAPRPAGTPEEPAGADRRTPSPGTHRKNDTHETTYAPATPQSRNGLSDADGSDDWRSTNDARWQRAEKLREPKAGGITPSGLPRRVPKANLIEGTAEATPQTGPQVSRAPEDIRGRLSSLRRGVQRGRDANAGNTGATETGTDTNGPGRGPGGTYHQER
ncbi:nitrate- and nitrite sensing domain-containing protein [Streptomyces sp. NBC_01498]|uniref:sensor histidine kinase n=1 Tax=Streptomyces sp. NBC_01498 TaxID=2975870 RepID=UPI002E7B9730|nr:nitrate- and nitrite sensing domain-containing protein [Streptomyces sp. NBC_01498]WTL24451.1 nitrate- and nitrite sensing domain-containing protein [Streptomyces sp. NBC_01498]